MNYTIHFQNTKGITGGMPFPNKNKNKKKASTEREELFHYCLPD